MSTTSASSAFLEAIKTRRSYYAITDKSPIPDSQVVSIVQEAVTHVPSSFNSQPVRALVVFGTEHAFVWDTVLAVLKPIVPEDAYPATVQKVEGCFKAGHGTVLFWTDVASVKKMQDAFPLYQDRFPIWAEHSNGMTQFVVWTALEKEGLGATLQHYNPLIDEKLREHFDLPVTWQLVAQLPFGTPAGQPGEKTFIPIEERVKVAGL